MSDFELTDKTSTPCRQIPEDVKSQARRYVQRRIQDGQEQREMLEMLGLTDDE